MNRCFVSLAVLVGLLTLLSGCGVEGLHDANPATRIDATATGFHFSNNKDAEMKLKKGEYDPSTKKLMVEDLEIKDNASKVRESNAVQMEGMAKQAEANWNGAVSFLEKVPDIVSKFTPWVQPNYTDPSKYVATGFLVLAVLFAIPIVIVLFFTLLIFLYVIFLKLRTWATTRKATTTTVTAPA